MAAEQEDQSSMQWRLAALLAGSHSLIDALAGKFTFGSFASLHFILKSLANSSRDRNSMSSSGSRWSVSACYRRGLGDLCCQTCFAVGEVFYGSILTVTGRFS